MNQICNIGKGHICPSILKSCAINLNSYKLICHTILFFRGVLSLVNHLNIQNVGRKRRAIDIFDSLSLFVVGDFLLLMLLFLLKLHVCIDLIFNIYLYFGLLSLLKWTLIMTWLYGSPDGISNFMISNFRLPTPNFITSGMVE